MATIVLIRTVDRDVVVILVGIFHDLSHHHQECSYGSALAQGSTSATPASTQSAKNSPSIQRLCRMGTLRRSSTCVTDECTIYTLVISLCASVLMFHLITYSLFTCYIPYGRILGLLVQFQEYYSLWRFSYIRRI